MPSLTDLTYNDKSLLELAGEFIENTADARESLSEYSSTTRLTPAVLVEDSLLRLPQNNINGIMQTLLSIYTGHYLQAVAMLTKVGNVTVDKLLEPVSQKRGGLLDSVDRLGFESIAEWSKTEGALMDYSAEALKYKDKRVDRLPLGKRQSDQGGTRGSAVEVNKPANIAVGKMIHVTLGTGNESIVVPVAVQINPRSLDVNYLVDVLAAFIGKDNSMIGRWHRWRAGEIKSFMDYAFALDLIEEERKLMLKDRDGFFKEARARSNRGLVSKFLSGQKQMNVASNMIVISKSGQSQLESAMRGQFSNKRVLHKFFQNTGAMLLCIVDPTMERVRIYQRGIDETGNFTFEDLEPASTNPNASNINDVIKAYKLSESFGV